MDNNGCPTHLLVIGYLGKRIIMQLMFSLFGNNEIDDLKQPVKTSLRSVFSWPFSVINFIIPSKLNITGHCLIIWVWHILKRASKQDKSLWMRNLIQRLYLVIFCSIILSPVHLFLQNSSGPFFSQEKCHPATAQHICGNKFFPLPKLLLNFLPTLWFSYLDQQVGRTASNRYYRKPFFRPPAWFNLSGDESIFNKSCKVLRTKVRFKMRETYCKICNDFVSLLAIADFPLGNPSDIKKLNF